MWKYETANMCIRLFMQSEVALFKLNKESLDIYFIFLIYLYMLILYADL